LAGQLFISHYSVEWGCIFLYPDERLVIFPCLKVSPH
jgi:hypothetical protein